MSTPRGEEKKWPDSSCSSGDDDALADQNVARPGHHEEGIMPQADPTSSPTQSLQEQMAWGATNSSPASSNTLIGVEKFGSTSTTCNDNEMTQATAASPIVRTPSMRLREKLMAGQSYEEFGSENNMSKEIQVHHSVERRIPDPDAAACLDRKCSATGECSATAKTASPAVESLPCADEPIPAQHVQSNHDMSESYTNNATAIPIDRHEVVRTSPVHVVPQDNGEIARPGAYAIPGPGIDDSSPSCTHSAASSNHEDGNDNVGAHTDPLDAFCVEDEGVVAADVVVESGLDGSKDAAPPPPIWVKHKNCSIAALVLVLVAAIMAALGAAGVLTGTGGSGSGSDDGPTLPKASFNETVTLLGPFPGSKYGHRVSFAQQGGRLSVSTKENDSTGAGFATVYDLVGSQALQVGQIITGTKGDIVAKLSKNGRRLVVGEGGSDGRFGVEPEIGQSRIFELNETSNLWELIGQTIYGDRVNSGTGSDVSISSHGDTIVTSSPLHGSITGGDDLGAGAVRTYGLTSDGDWKELGSGIFGVNEKQRLGWSVALSNEGTTLVVGSSWNRTIDESSHLMKLKVGSLSVYTFDEDVQEWVQLGQPIFGVNRDDIFGTRVAISSDGSIVAGASHRNGEAAKRAGHVRIFQYNQDGNSWRKMGSSITGIQEDDNLGPVALSADGMRVAVCAPGAGYAKVYDYVDNDWVLVGGGVIAIDEPGSAYTADVALSQDGFRLAVGSRDHGDERGAVRIFELPKRLQ